MLFLPIVEMLCTLCILLSPPRVYTLLQKFNSRTFQDFFLKFHGLGLIKTHFNGKIKLLPSIVYLSIIESFAGIGNLLVQMSKLSGRGLGKTCSFHLQLKRSAFSLFFLLLMVCRPCFLSLKARMVRLWNCRTDPIISGDTCTMDSTPKVFQRQCRLFFC